MSAIGTLQGDLQRLGVELRIPARSITATVLAPASVLFGAPIRRRVYSTSSAVKGEPSCQRTPCGV